MKSLALIQLATLGAGYEAVQIASLRPDIEILEFIPLGKESQLLLRGPSETLLAYRRILRTADLEKSVIIENPDPRLLKAYYHLENARVEDFILVLESEFSGYLLETAQKLFTENLSVMDFHQPRFSGAISSLILTGADLLRLEKLVAKAASKKVKVSFVESPTPKTKTYFDLEPQ